MIIEFITPLDVIPLPNAGEMWVVSLPCGFEIIVVALIRKHLENPLGILRVREHFTERTLPDQVPPFLGEDFMQIVNVIPLIHEYLIRNLGCTDGFLF